MCPKIREQAYPTANRKLSKRRSRKRKINSRLKQNKDNIKIFSRWRTPKVRVKSVCKSRGKNKTKNPRRKVAKRNLGRVIMVLVLY